MNLSQLSHTCNTHQKQIALPKSENRTSQDITEADTKCGAGIRKKSASRNRKIFPDPPVFKANCRDQQQ